MPPTAVIGCNSQKIGSSSETSGGSTVSRLRLLPIPWPRKLTLSHRFATPFVAVDRLQERFDEFGIHAVTACELVRGLHPVDAPVLARDEAVEDRRHVDRDARLSVCHRFTLTRVRSLP